MQLRYKKHFTISSSEMFVHLILHRSHNLDVVVVYIKQK